MINRTKNVVCGMPKVVAVGEERGQEEPAKRADEADQSSDGPDVPRKIFRDVLVDAAPMPIPTPTRKTKKVNHVTLS
jgi:hypothetical protein